MNCNLPVYREAYKLFQGISPKIWSPLWLLERYVNAAITQIDRIRETTDQTSEYHGTWLLDQILVDVHFYFICWDKAQILLKHLAEAHGGPNLKKLWVMFEPICKPFNDARNHLEHIDTRLAKDPTETGSLEGDLFVFAGQKFDISEPGLKLLTDMYEKVIHIITIVDTSGKPLSPDEYQRLQWKPTITRQPPGHRQK